MEQQDHKVSTDGYNESNGKITLGSCLLWGFLAHLTNFGSMWVLPSVSCVSSVCQAASLSASPCSWQKLQTGALCTIKERLSFVHECTKYLSLGILRLSQGNLNYVHDHDSSFEHQENAELLVWLEAEDSGDSFLTHSLCCEHCCFCWPFGQRCCHQTVPNLYL